MDAMAGLDMSMPGDITAVSGTSYWSSNLTAYVLNGSTPEARLDDTATQILASWYFVGQDNPDYPKTNFNRFYPLDPVTNEHVDVQGNHSLLVREIDVASIVLLKNVNGALPLSSNKPRKLVLIGSDASPAQIAGPNEFQGETGIDGVLITGWGSA
jgi:beta-glucosidase